jgi:kynurenine formamidase
MKLIDLSQPLFDQAPNCPFHPPPQFSRLKDHPKDGWRLETISLATHTGSHVDSPLHRVAGGKSITELPLTAFVGPAFIADLRGIAPAGPIDADLLARSLPANCADHIVLLATGWGDKRAKTEEWLHRSPSISRSGAKWLVDHKVRGVGIDHYSISTLGPENDETHAIILSAGIWIVEELHFPAEVFALPQPLKFWTLPMNWPGCSGAFCRPVVEVES